MLIKHFKEVGNGTSQCLTCISLQSYHCVKNLITSKVTWSQQSSVEALACCCWISLLSSLLFLQRVVDNQPDTPFLTNIDLPVVYQPNHVRW